MTLGPWGFSYQLASKDRDGTPFSFSFPRFPHVK